MEMTAIDFFAQMFLVVLGVLVIANRKHLPDFEDGNVERLIRLEKIQLEAAHVLSLMQPCRVA